MGAMVMRRIVAHTWLAVAATVGLCVMTGVVHAADNEQVVITGFVPAPQGMFNRLVVEKLWDWDTGGLNYDNNVDWYVDPSGITRLRNLRVIDSMVIEGDLEVYRTVTARQGFFGPFFQDTDADTSGEPPYVYLRVDPSGTSQFTRAEATWMQAERIAVGTGSGLGGAGPSGGTQGDLTVWGSSTSQQNGLLDVRGRIYNKDWGTLSGPDPVRVQDNFSVMGTVNVYGAIASGPDVHWPGLGPLPGDQPVVARDPQGVRLEARTVVGPGEYGFIVAGPTGHEIGGTPGWTGGTNVTHPLGTEDIRVRGDGDGPSTPDYGITLGGVRRTTWPSGIDDIVFKKAVGPFNTSTVFVYCPAGYRLLSCAGSRHVSATDNCGEDDCGYVGTVAVLPGGVPAADGQVPTGCKTGIDARSDNQPVAQAFCVRE